MKKKEIHIETIGNNSDKKQLSPEMELLVYDTKTVVKEKSRQFKKLSGLIDRDKNNLLIVNDLNDSGLIDSIGTFFEIEPMILENVLGIRELPNFKESGDQLLLNLKLLDLEASGKLVQYHLGLVLGSYFVIIFKNFDNEVFKEIIDRIDNGKSKARQKKVDYLFYLLTDCIIDTYYSIVNMIDNKIDKMEVVLLEKPETNYIHNLYHLKQPMSEMRGIVYSIREALLNIVQGDNPLIDDDTIPFFHDVKDHVNQIVHMYEASRDTLSDLLEINNSNTNNRLNGTMKVLTIITTLFIPLTLISGIYGMNFKHMPELNWKFGYPFAIVVMLMTAAIMFYFMKKKKLL